MIQPRVKDDNHIVKDEKARKKKKQKLPDLSCGQEKTILDPEDVLEQPRKKKVKVKMEKEAMTVTPGTLKKEITNQSMIASRPRDPKIKVEKKSM